MRTRRNLLLGALGAAAAAGDLYLPSGAAGAAVEAAPFLVVDFTGRGDSEVWSSGSARWFSRFGSRVGVSTLRGRITVPAPLASAADSQPVSVFLLDHDSAQPAQRLVFSVSLASTRPGVILGATNLESYLAVSVEDGDLVLSRFERTRRVVLHRAPGQFLDTEHVFTLDVRVSSGSVMARLGVDGVLPAKFALNTRAKVEKGMAGVLVVAEPPMLATELAVLRYELGGPKGAVTPARETYLLSGTPVASQGGVSVNVRVGAERASVVAVQSSHDPGFRTGVATTAPVTVTAPSYTATTRIEVGSGVWWRAVLTDPISGAHHTTEAQLVAPPDLARPLVLAAASCAQLWNATDYHALTRLVDEAAPTPPAMLVYQGDFGYPSNSVNSCLRAELDFYLDRITRFLRSPKFISLRTRMPVGFTMDDHEYGPPNNCDRTTLYPWTVDLWNTLHADPSTTGYFDWRYGDVHCLTLDGRRYSDPVTSPETPDKTKLGIEQKQWLRTILESSDARVFVIFSADIFATRFDGIPQIDCWWYGWTTEYAELMTLFHTTQLAGKRVIILSGDSHGQRIHNHPDPAQRTTPASVVEFICSGLRARTWAMENQPDPTIDPQRRVKGKSGLGMITIDPPQTPGRTITLRSINGDDGPLDLFPPLRLPFTPTSTNQTQPLTAHAASPTHHPHKISHTHQQ